MVGASRGNPGVRCLDQEKLSQTCLVWNSNWPDLSKVIQALMLVLIFRAILLKLPGCVTTRLIKVQEKQIQPDEQ